MRAAARHPFSSQGSTSPNAPFPTTERDTKSLTESRLPCLAHVGHFSFLNFASRGLYHCHPARAGSCAPRAWHGALPWPRGPASSGHTCRPGTFSSSPTFSSWRRRPTTSVGGHGVPTEKQEEKRTGENIFSGGFSAWKRVDNCTTRVRKTGAGVMNKVFIKKSQPASASINSRKRTGHTALPVPGTRVNCTVPGRSSLRGTTGTVALVKFYLYRLPGSLQNVYGTSVPGS